MTKRDMQASEYAAESYGKTYRKRCVSHMDGAERTPQTHTTHAQCSVQSEGTVAPAAWLAVAADGSESSAVYMLKEQAEAAGREWGWFVFPLYRQPQPTLTEEEQEAVAVAIVGSLPGRAATLRNLLERTA